MTIQEKLKIIKQTTGLTQTQLAEKLGVSFVAFNNWWLGKSEPRAEKAEKINELLLRVTGASKIPADELAAKKMALVKRAKKYPNVLKKILTIPNLRDAFVLKLTYHSNRIEGSTMTEPDTAAVIFKNIALSNRTLTEQLEAKNHQTALLYLFDYLHAKKSINEVLVLKLHSILMNGILPDAGSYRRHAVRILGVNLPTSNYLKIPDLLPDVIKEAQKKVKDPINQASAVHARFEQIHPFSDGNGRIGRLLLNAILLKANYAPAIIKQEEKKQYYDYLYKAQSEGDLSLFENFLCDSVNEGYNILEAE